MHSLEMIMCQVSYARGSHCVGNKQAQIQYSWTCSASWGHSLMCLRSYLFIEKYVCFLYGQKKIDNEARSAIFWRKMIQEHKVVDISLLPPCSDSLRKHAERANYVARIWRRACYPIMAMEDPWLAPQLSNRLDRGSVS